MKALLINLPINTRYHPCVYPMGLGYLGAMLLKKQCDVSVLDIWLNHYDENFVIEFLKAHCCEFDLYAMSGMVTTYRYAKWLSYEIRKHSKKATICAGGSLSTAGVLLLQNSEVDVVCLGEGEKVASDLMDAIAFRKGFEGVANILFKEGDRIIQTKKEPPLDIDLIPMPAWELFDMPKYTSTQFLVPINTPRITMLIERGCPFECTFCYRNFGRVARYRSVDNIIKEIKTVIDRFNIGHVDFLDEIFNSNANQVKELCTRIIKEKINITWRCIGRTNLVCKETLKLMFEAGCKWIGYGIESGSQEMLDRMNKKQTVADIEKSIRLSREAGMIVTGTFLIGMPGETEATVEETRQFCVRNKIFNKPFFPVPYPGTLLYNYCVRNGLVASDEKYVLSLEKDITELIVNLTEMEDEKLVRLRDELNEELGQRYPLWEFQCESPGSCHAL